MHEVNKIANNNTNNKKKIEEGHLFYVILCFYHHKYYYITVNLLFMLEDFHFNQHHPDWTWEAERMET